MQPFLDNFLENVAYALGDRTLDYIIVNHMEPDHCANLGRLLERYPDMQVICNSKTLGMIQQFFAEDVSGRATVVKRRRHLQQRSACVHLCDGADGPLAGSDGNL